MARHRQAAFERRRRGPRALVIGGGAAGLSAAWALSQDPRRQWQIEVVQTGWRLGGKGRSGRLMRGPLAGRNVEHGIHVLFGFYHNVFTVLREVYRAVQRPASHPLATWRDGLVPIQRLLFRGDPDFTVRFPVDPAAAPGADRLDELANLRAWPDGPGLARHVARLLATAAVDLRSDLRTDPSTAWTWRRHLAAIMAATIRGASAAGLLRCPDHASFLRAAETLQDIDYRAWLRRHGASDAAVDSPFVRTLYQLGFADDSRADTGTTLDGLIRIAFGYTGAPLYRFSGGMGDVVFAPWYEALQARGVRFSFFHRVDDMRLSGRGDRITSVSARIQAAPRGDYRPLIEVAGVPAWPDEPLWDQLEGGVDLAATGVDFESDHSAALSPPVGHRTWHDEADFDVVILAVPPAAQHRLAACLIDHPNPEIATRWKTLHERIDSTATAMMHGWLARDFAATGWPNDAMAGDDTKPFDCWTDMSSALAWEPPASSGPRGLFYACAALAAPEDADDDPVTAARWQAATRRAGDDWLAGVNGPAPFTTSDLIAVDTRANLQRSDRYTRSVPGSRRARFAADQSGFDNLFVAGDWTLTGLDAGCVEAAVMSGLQAARAVCGYPVAVVGEHPDITLRAQASPAYVDRFPRHSVPHPESRHASLR